MAQWQFEPYRANHHPAEIDTGLVFELESAQQVIDPIMQENAASKAPKRVGAELISVGLTLTDLVLQTVTCTLL